MTSTCSNNLKSAKSQSRATWWAECTNTGNRFLTMSCTALFFICTSMKSWNLRGGCSFSFNSPAVYFMHTAGACWYFVHSGCTFKPKLSLYCVLLTVLFYLHLKGRRWSEIKASDKRISDSNVDFVRRCVVSSHIPFTWDIMWTKLTFESKVNKWICCQRSKVKQLLVHRYSVFHNERSQPSVSGCRR